MKIAVIGNCQVQTIGACLRVLLPDAEVHDLWTSPQRQEASEAMLAGIEAYDVVCMHPMHSGTFGPFVHDVLRSKVDRLLFIPPLAFDGFQPDDIVIAAARGPFGNHHSAIIVSSFLNGLTVDRCAKLFNGFIYASLGYFERFEQSKQVLLQRTDKYELPLHDHWACWDAPFMYDVQHPKLQPLASLAEVLASRINGGKDVRATWLATEVPTDFGKKNFFRWPVYPEIARHLRVPPDDMVFRYPHASPGIDLCQFTHRSYQAYANLERAVLEAAVPIEYPILQELVRRDS